MSYVGATNLPTKRKEFGYGYLYTVQPCSPGLLNVSQIEPPEELEHVDLKVMSIKCWAVKVFADSGCHGLFYERDHRFDRGLEGLRRD